MNQFIKSILIKLKMAPLNEFGYEVSVRFYQI